MLQLMGQARTAIVEDRYPEFIKEFFTNIYSRREDFPSWAVNALKGVGVEL